MDIFIEKINKRKKIKFQGTVKKLLEELDINPETVLVVKNNELITEMDTVKDSDIVKLVSVISGG